MNAVNLGPTDTSWMRDKSKQRLAVKSPAKRVGEPKDVARLVTFLAGDETASITGQVIHSEGGSFVRRWLICEMWYRAAMDFRGHGGERREG